MMIDKLKLCDTNVAIQKRYDDFVRWISSKNNNVTELLAEELGVDSSVVDVFFELGNLDEEEFIEIDNNKIDVGALFVFIRCSKDIRQKVYCRSNILLSSQQPLKAIREFIDNEKVDLDILVNSLSAKSLGSIATYLKSRDIDEGALNKGFRSMIVNAAKSVNKKSKISDKMIDWILEALTYDQEKQLGVFLNGDLKSKFPADFEIIKSIIENIKVHIS